MSTILRWCAAALLLAACNPTSAPPSSPSSSDPSSSPSPASDPPSPVPAAPASIDAGWIKEDSSPAEADASAPAEPRIDVRDVLFPDAATTTPSAARCDGAADAGERVRCMFAARYEGDEEARRIAQEMFDASGDVAGVQVEQDMDGGFRGRIHLVPERPVGRFRKHLGWVAAARRDFDAFFAALSARAAAPIAYRHRPLAYRFFRSVGRTTPSAYAADWTVSYNVSGSLHGSAEAVRDTIFHEVFHLNDQAHGDWSPRALGALYDGIVKRCGTRVPCLKPYAPGDTMVRGGTYYAFQPDNGEPVHEYAAELALRYFREQRAALLGPAAGRSGGKGSFKCGPPENGRAWSLLVAEFFGGVDATPPCPG